MPDQKPTLEYRTPSPPRSLIRSLFRVLNVLMSVASLGLFMLLALYVILLVIHLFGVRIPTFTIN